MFGTYRYVLACLVLGVHYTAWPGIGSFAVFGFYSLSGYLMCLILDQRYGFSARGLGRYASNRALRIYPPYLVVIVLTALAVAALPETATAFRECFRFPDSALLWLKQLFIFGIEYDDPFRLVPPVWSLYAELSYYVAIGLVLGRNRSIATAWFVVSVAYTAWLLATNQPWPARYYPVAAATLPFSLGAMIYFYRDHAPRLHWAWAIPMLAVFTAHAFAARYLYGLDGVRTWGFYGSLVLSALLQIHLMSVRAASLPPWLARLDRRLGDLSYPIFLCHTLVGLLIAQLLAVEGIASSILWVVSSFVATNALAAFLHATLESRIEALRDRIRGMSRAAQTTG
jgi:peptidoglycan/LPS O-acetylase OafA/YrhL